ncbi:MarR family winged helix-turn-helix transcriptional regulator [Patiriisocius marinus]|uniref:MarR family winged helix-turn-helix transcriptional regulator n=1 Tax=Patiriisocius marinus TaxID=1397112 RepID=UPI0027957159|nr:MarR family transcriptional regulator [Patiriisocius marinus]
MRQKLKQTHTFVPTTVVYTNMGIEEEIKSDLSLRLETKTIINIIFTSRIIEEGLLSHIKQFDISAQQYNVLRILRGQKGAAANLSTVQERMVDKSSNTTRLIDKLIKKNFVKRQVCKKNRRKIELFITPQGLDVLETLDPITEENNKKQLANLTKEELNTLNTLLDKLRN